MGGERFYKYTLKRYEEREDLVERCVRLSTIIEANGIPVTMTSKTFFLIEEEKYCQGYQ